MDLVVNFYTGTAGIHLSSIKSSTITNKSMLYSHTGIHSIVRVVEKDAVQFNTHESYILNDSRPSQVLIDGKDCLQYIQTKKVNASQSCSPHISLFNLSMTKY